MLEKFFYLDFHRVDLILLATVPVIINLGIFLYVFLKLPSTRVNVTFSVFVLIEAAWQFSSGLLHLSNNKQTAFEWYIVSSIISVMIVPFGIYLLLFITGWIKKISEYFILFVLLIPNLICVLIVSSRLDSYTILPSKNWNWLINPNPTFLTSMIYVWITINAFGLLFMHWGYFFTASSKQTKIQALILASGYTFTFLIGILSEVIFPFILGKNDIPLGPSTSVIFSLFALYAILKYKMLDFSPRHQWDVIVNNMNESIIIVDNEDRIMYVNRKMCEEMEYEPYEMEGKIGFELLLKDNKEKERIIKVNKERSQGKSGRYEICLSTKSGKQKWVIINGSPYSNRNGKIIGSIGIISNIDQLKKANLQIENERKKAESLINNMPGTFYLFDRDGNLLLWNNTFQKASGYAKNEIKGMRPLDFFDENDKPKVKQSIEKVFETGYDEIEASFLKKDNTYMPCIFTGFRYEYEGKQCLIGMGIDITFQKETETKLKVKEEYYKALVEQAPDAIIINDKDMNMLDINSYGCELLEYTKKELLKMKVSEIITEKNKIEKPINLDLIKKGKLSVVDRILKTKSGKEIIVEVRIRQLSDGNYQAFLTDITERKKHSDELNKLNLELTRKTETLEKSNAELEQFAYVASHDMQEPLRMVSSFLKLLETQYKNVLDEKATEYITHAVDGATRMKQVIYDILQYSKAGRNSNDMAIVNLNEVIDEILKIEKTEILNKNAQVIFENLPEIYARKTSIQQVFQNLIDNALKYSAVDRTPVIKISSEETDTSWKFCVSDNGVGIEPKYFDKIFIIFKRISPKSDDTGSGIGLAICKKIVELHNGKIWVESVPGEGTSFYFTISKAL